MAIRGTATTAAIIAEQVRLLYDGAAASLLANAALASILAFLQSDVVAPHKAIVWIQMIVAVTMGRILLLAAYRRAVAKAAPIANSPHWLALYRIGTLSNAALWGLASLMLFPSHDIPHQTFLAFTLGGLSAGAVVSLAADSVTALGFTLLSLPPLAIQLLLEGETIPRAMAAMVVLFWGFLAASSRRMCRDIIERKQAQIALDAQDALLRKLSDRIPGTLCQFRYCADGSFSVPYASNGLRATYELAPEAVRLDGAAIFSRVHPEDADGFARSIATSSNTLSAWKHDYRVRLPQRGERWLGGNAVPERLEDGSVLWHGYITDITERKAAEQALDNARQQAEAANTAKSLFLSSMSHELRTPLNAIFGFAQLLELEEDLNARQRDYAEEIMRAGQHLLELITDVLDLSKIESGKVDFIFEAVCCGELLDDCLPLLRPLADKYRIQVECEDLSAIVVRADRIRLKQTLINLISNAIKYNRPDGSVYIHTLAANPGRWRLAVSDTGPGIPTEQLSKLFQPFNRLGAEGGNIEGTGIGLVICRRIAELMDGNIGVESVAGKGSTFWIDLPAGNI